MLASCHHQLPFLFSLLSLFLQGSWSRVQLLFLIYYSFLSLPVPLLILTCFIYLPIVSPSPSPCGPVSFHRRPQFPPVFRDYFPFHPVLQSPHFLCFSFPSPLWAYEFYFRVKNRLQKHNKLSSFRWSSHHSVAVEPHGLCALLVPPDGTLDDTCYLISSRSWEIETTFP